MPDTLWLHIVVFVPHCRGGSEGCVTALFAPTSVFPQMFITVMKECCNFLLNQTFYKKGYFLLLVKVVCHIITKIKGILHSIMIPLFTCQHWQSKGSYLKKGRLKKGIMKMSVLVLADTLREAFNVPSTCLCYQSCHY